jgi:succinate-semialdehyde dehydrogenase / glutarate-semialdehyde dehydrogenase
MKSINPVTGKKIHSFVPHTDKGVDKIINAVGKTWYFWRSTSFTYRFQLMQNLGSLLKSRRDDLARLITLEMGKIFKESKSEVEKCAWVCDYYAENAEKFLQSETIATQAWQSYVTFQPLGTLLAIMPWNFPFWQVFRFLAPVLMAGNTVVLKHASNVPGCAMAIEELVREAGFPENAFRTLLIESDKVERVIHHPVVRAVTLTGSVPAGKAVAGMAGKVVKKCVLELGGSDPYIILKDANIEEAVRICTSARLLNAGQSCIGAKRFIVEEPVYSHFLELFAFHMSQASMGDPFDPDTDLGPLAHTDLRNELHRQVTESVHQGAEIIIGGEIPHCRGAFYPPTILEHVNPGMPAYDEELFGPVASLMRASDEEEAIKIANDTLFGLGAALFTGNREKGMRIAETKLEAGSCFVNDSVKSDPRLPFGGIKESGYGRELSSFGIREFVNSKTVVVK